MKWGDGGMDPRRLKALAATVLVALAALAGAVYWVVSNDIRQDNENIQAANQVNVGSGYRDITYQGKRYRYNNLITCILYAGLDSVDEIKASTVYTRAPRADTIALLVLDEYHHRMTVIAMSRDTMTEIHRFTVSGKDRGTYLDHLCYAYTYGDGGEVSAKNLCTAVSDLLYGVPVQEYVVTNRSSMPMIADLAGKVTVTAPNDDLAELGVMAGDQVTIDSSNLEQFIRSRDTGADFSNTGRMARQQAYINGAMNQLRSKVEDSPTEVWNTLESAGALLLTSITRNKYLDMAKALKNASYSSSNYYTLEGKQATGDRYDEFYPDEDALLKKVIELFYLPM